MSATTDAATIPSRIDQITGVRARIAALKAENEGLARRVLMALDRRAEGADLDALARAAVPSDPAAAVFGLKYLALAQRVVGGARIAERLRLHRRGKIDILDLGAGGGFFGFAAQCCGHSTVAIEPARPAEFAHARVDFAPILSFLGVPHSPQAILPGVPLQRDAALAPGRRFDLVTAFAIMFNRRTTVSHAALAGAAPEFWDRSDYEGLLNDLRSNWLKPGGRVLLRFNERTDGTARRGEAAGQMIAHHAEVGALLAPYVVRDMGDFGLMLDLG